MIRGTQLLQSSTLNDVVSSQDTRRLFALVLWWGALRYCTYWIISTGLRRIWSINFVSGWRRYISSTNFDTAFRSYDGHVNIFCAVVCVCAVSVLSAFTDRCRLRLLPVSLLCEVVPCVACVRWILCITYVALIFLRKTIAYVPCVITETAVRCSRRQLRILSRGFVALSYARERFIAIGSVSVCLFVCLSHAGIHSKLITVGSRGFHHSEAQGRCPFFWIPTFIPKVLLWARASNENGWVKTRIFDTYNITIPQK